MTTPLTPAEKAELRSAMEAILRGTTVGAHMDAPAAKAVLALLDEIEHEREATAALGRSFDKVRAENAALVGAHARRVADEFAIVKAQRDAGERRVIELERELQTVKTIARQGWESAAKTLGVVPPTERKDTP